MLANRLRDSVRHMGGKIALPRELQPRTDRRPRQDLDGNLGTNGGQTDERLKRNAARSPDTSS
jgi:hypothetical protein